MAYITLRDANQSVPATPFSKCALIAANISSAVTHCTDNQNCRRESKHVGTKPVD